MGSSQKGSTSQDGVILSNVVIDEWGTYGGLKSTELDLVNRAVPNDDKTGVTYEKTFSIVRDNLDFTSISTLEEVIT